MSPRKQNAGQPHCHFPYHTKRKILQCAACRRAFLLHGDINAYYNAKESAFQHFSSAHWEETGDGSVSPFSGKTGDTEPSPVLILHAVMCGFAVELQGPDIVSVVEKPGNEILHGIDGIFLCVMAQDDTGVLIGEI